MLKLSVKVTAINVQELRTALEEVGDDMLHSLSFRGERSEEDHSYEWELDETPEGEDDGN